MLLSFNISMMIKKHMKEETLVKDKSWHYYLQVCVCAKGNFLTHYFIEWAAKNLSAQGTLKKMHAIV